MLMPSVFLIATAMAILAHGWRPCMQKLISPRRQLVLQESRHSFITPLKPGELEIASFNSIGKATISALLLSCLAPDMSIAVDKQKKTKKPKVLETELGIKYIELKKGSGSFPSDGDYVVIDYTAFLQNGTVFDSTEAKGRKPLTFRYGRKQVIPGLESVLSYMQTGGEVTCSIPSTYAYGAKGVCIEGQGCIVPPNENLKYAVKLKKVAASFN